MFIWKLLSILIIDHAAIDINTHASDHMITFFALFIFSSSQPEIRYSTPPIITAITAMTATYFISVAMREPITQKTADSEFGHGRAPQSISGILEA